MVYLLTQAPVIVTTTRIFAVKGMRGHLALSPALPTLASFPGRNVCGLGTRLHPHALELGQVRPRSRLEIRLGLGRGGEFAALRLDSCSMFHYL